MATQEVLLAGCVHHTRRTDGALPASARHPLLERKVP